LTRLPFAMQRQLPRYPEVPATLIGRLAVNAAHVGRRYGEHLLIDALQRAYEARHAIGSAVVLVEAKDRSAACFYRRYGFEPLSPERSRLYIPMDTVAQLF
jgi:predicted GNAT family N-acyltransferase